MRSSRLLSILLRLNVHGRVSAQQLADELEVSLRTIYRDIEALGAAGIPVYATRGRHGGFQLMDNYRTRLTGISPDEADALFLAGLPGAAADLGLGSVLAATQLKLLAALPPELRERAGRIRDRFHLDAPGWLREVDAPPHLVSIADAVWSQRRVEVRYERANRTVVDRVLEPLGLVLKGGTWYLVASVRADGRGPRTYRVSRVRAVEVLEQAFQRPDGFDLATHWADYQREYEQRIFKDSATIRLSADGRSLLFLIGTAAARAGHAAMQAPDPDGWARTTVPIESVRHALHGLMQLGADVEVLEPVELRELVANSAQAMTRRYARLSGGGTGSAGDVASAGDAGSAGDVASAGGAGSPGDTGSVGPTRRSAMSGSGEGPAGAARSGRAESSPP
ncbi:MAG: transcriptional regulator [Pseudonocardiales bacterium]|nr:MAG: transcriptional regulator [Pseudonocardiales bacterium]